MKNLLNRCILSYVLSVLVFFTPSLFANPATNKDSIKADPIQQLIYEREAVKNWIVENRCKNAKGDVDELVSLVYKHSKENDLDPHFVLGLIKQESCFNTTAKSFAGAYGYMQVIPKWHPEEVKGRSLFKPTVGIEAGTLVLSKYIDLANGNLKKALRLYSGGANKYYENVIGYKLAIKKYVSFYTQEQVNKQEYLLAKASIEKSQIVVAKVQTQTSHEQLLDAFKRADEKSKSEIDLLGELIKARFIS